MDEIKNLHDYWLSQAFEILHRWIDAGFEDHKLLEWALEMGEAPFVDAVESLLGEKSHSRSLGVRRMAFVKTYEYWEDTEHDKVSKTWSILVTLLESGRFQERANQYFDELVTTFGLSQVHIELIQFLFLNQKYGSMDNVNNFL